MFNFSDLYNRIILDEEYGLCPQIQPPGTHQFYPSLPHWLAQRRQKRKLLGEEMRLLYVALTRAAQRLVLAGTGPRSRLEKKWPPQAEHPPHASEIMAARDFLDWLGPWILRSTSANALADSGGSPLLNWTIYDDNDPRLAAPPPVLVTDTKVAVTDILPEVRDRLAWRHPFPAETKLPAKASVTSLRRQIAGEDGNESVRLFAGSTSRTEQRRADRLTAAEIGLAHHTFLQWAALDSLSTPATLKAEAKRLTERNLLTAEQSADLDFDGLAAFWQSETGREILGKSAQLQRELAFTARFSATELRDLGCAEFAEAGAGEFIVVQGVIDLAVVLPGEIWLLDFKTDHFPAAELDEKIKAYRPQLALYALAIARIHGRPVTKKWLHFLAVRRTVPL
jgi:ATP-dependent helicase/nuclease subunit A